MEQKILYLSKGEKQVIDDVSYEIIKGKLVVREVFMNGKVLGHELYLEKNEIVANFFSILFQKNQKVSLQEGNIEIEALEMCELREISIQADKNDCSILEKINLQLLKMNILKYYYQIYDSAGYILAILKFYSDDKGILKKSEVTPETFGMISKSQFYELYKKIKKEKFVVEAKGKIMLRLEKIDEYLKESHLNGKKKRRNND